MTYQRLLVRAKTQETPITDLWDLKAVAFWTVDVLAGSRQQGHVTKRAVEIVGARIRKMREDAGFSQEKFAQKIQIDRSYYGRIERGGQNISVSTICTIAAGLGVSPAVLLADLTISDCSESAHTET